MKSCAQTFLPSVPSTSILNSQNATSLVYNGNWTHQQTTGTSSSSSTSMLTSQQYASVSTTFSGATALAINGTTDWGGGTYSVTVDGQTTALNESMYWLMPNNVLYVEDNLDPSSNHTVNITNTGSPGTKLWLNSITLFQSGNGSSSSGSVSSSSTNSTATGGSGTRIAVSKKTNPGVIAGPIIAIIALAALITAFLFWRKRRRVPTSRSTVDLSFLDRGKAVEAMPFPTELRNSRRRTVAGLQEPEMVVDKHDSYSSDNPPPLPMKSPQRLGSFSSRFLVSPGPISPVSPQQMQQVRTDSPTRLPAQPIVTGPLLTDPHLDGGNPEDSDISPPQSLHAAAVSSPLYVPPTSSSPPRDYWSPIAESPLSPRTGIRPLPPPPRRKAVPSYLEDQARD